MKKYLWTMAAMVVFAIGFAASDEETSSNSSSKESEQATSEESGQVTSKKKEEVTPKAFFEPGHTYISNEIKTKYSAYESYHKYEMKLYNDGSLDLKVKYRYPNHEIEDITITCNNCKKLAFYESKRDIIRKGYNISGDYWSDGSKHGVNFGVDYEGHIWDGGIDWETLGSAHDGYFTKN